MDAINENQVRYICEQMMGVHWVPNISSEVFDVVRKCDSKLELMYLLGVGFHIYENALKHGNGHDEYPAIMKGELSDGQDGVWFVEPWFGYCPACGNGPSALMFVPQYKSPEKDIHHDFGVFTAGDNGAHSGWNFQYAVEIDGYGVHKDRRKSDEFRDRGLSYPIYRYYEESLLLLHGLLQQSIVIA